MAVPVLEGVVAYLCFRSDGDVNVHSALVSRLKALGARVSNMIAKDVTHVIFQPKLNTSPAEKKAENAELRLMFLKVNKVCCIDLTAAIHKALHDANVLLQPSTADCLLNAQR